MSATQNAPLTLVVVTAGTSDPSSTRMLADRTAQRVSELASRRGHEVQVRVIDLRQLATEITTALISQLTGPKLHNAIAALAEADGIVASTPVYKAGASGLFTSFFQVLDNDLLIAKPVVLAATAGTARHALVVDDQLRSLFAYLRTATVPTSLFASSEDWGDPALNTRIERPADQGRVLAQLPARVRQRQRHRGRHRPGLRPHAPGHRRIGRLSAASSAPPLRLRLGRLPVSIRAEWWVQGVAAISFGSQQPTHRRGPPRRSALLKPQHPDRRPAAVLGELEEVDVYGAVGRKP
jgi:FMN reductase